MEGWKLNKGNLNEKDLTYPEIWNYFNILFSNKSKNQSSYKYGFVRSLLENIFNSNQYSILTYTQIFDTFTRIYWNMVIVNGLTQTDKSHKESGIEKSLRKFAEGNNAPIRIHYDSLSIEAQKKINIEIKKICMRYVVGAVYGDTNGLFYSFDNKNEELKLNPIVHNFLKEHQQILIKLTNYELIKFTQAVNSQDLCSNIIKKIENITARTSLLKYRVKLESIDRRFCFYCEKKFGVKSVIHVDHFIPWSIIYHDKIWNLVLSCPSCNTSKSDRLAEWRFVEKLITRNKILEKLYDTDIKQDLVNYTENNLFELYNYSGINGCLRDWKPPAKF